MDFEITNVGASVKVSQEPHPTLRMFEDACVTTIFESYPTIVALTKKSY